VVVVVVVVVAVLLLLLLWALPGEECMQHRARSPWPKGGGRSTNPLTRRPEEEEERDASWPFTRLGGGPRRRRPRCRRLRRRRPRSRYPRSRRRPRRGKEERGSEQGTTRVLLLLSSQVKSSQVKSTFKMAVALPPPLVPIAGASDREGRSRRNRHHWIAPSRGIIPISLILIIAAPQGFNIEPFLEVYCIAMQD